jgi:hypothetical protein
MPPLWRAGFVARRCLYAITNVPLPLRWRVTFLQTTCKGMAEIMKAEAF